MNGARALVTLAGLGLAMALVASAACRCDRPRSGTAPTPDALIEEPEPPAPVAVAEAPAAAAPTVPTATAATPPAAPGTAWATMSKEQRGRFMKDTVLPTMHAAFSAFNADEYAKMKCATCHGPGAQDKTFKMPNPKLPRLPTDEAGFKALAAKDPEVMKFMRETVVPQMAKLLGEPAYDPATHQGFGCFRCHTAK